MRCVLLRREHGVLAIGPIQIRGYHHEIQFFKVLCIAHFHPQTVPARPLGKGGAFARFANHPFRDKGNPALSEEIDEIYHAYYDRFHQRKREAIREYTEKDARERALIAGKYGFSDLRYHLFYRQRVFSASEYLQLLGTYSDHIVIEESIQKPFFEAIAAAINRHGGTITLYDTIDLQLARK